MSSDYYSVCLNKLVSALSVTTCSLTNYTSLLSLSLEPNQSFNFFFQNYDRKMNTERPFSEAWKRDRSHTISSVFVIESLEL